MAGSLLIPSLPCLVHAFTHTFLGCPFLRTPFSNPLSTLPRVCPHTLLSSALRTHSRPLSTLVRAHALCPPLRPGGLTPSVHPGAHTWSAPVRDTGDRCCQGPVGCCQVLGYMLSLTPSVRPCARTQVAGAVKGQNVAAGGGIVDSEDDDDDTGWDDGCCSSGLHSQSDSGPFYLAWVAGNLRILSVFTPHTPPRLPSSHSSLLGFFGWVPFCCVVAASLSVAGSLCYFLLLDHFLGLISFCGLVTGNFAFNWSCGLDSPFPPHRLSHSLPPS